MDLFLASIRFAHFTATMFVFGAGAFLFTFTNRPLRKKLAPPLRAAVIAASLVALFSAILWLMLEAASMGGDLALAVDPDAIGEVMVSTAFGGVWLGRLPCLVALVGVALVTRLERPALITLVAGLTLASLALVDHGAMQAGLVGAAHRANDALHLIATGGWLGGLPPFLLLLRLASHGEYSEPAGEAMLRFSSVGHFAVIVVLATGAVNIALTSGHPPWPPTSPYRALLIAKIAVVAMMIALALFNRYVLLPEREHSPRRGAMLSRLALVELMLALLAVALVSYFGLLDPV